MDLDALLQPIRPDAPSGEDLYEAGRFVELDSEIYPPEVTSGFGNPDDEEERAETNWSRVESLLDPLLRETRDLRLAVWKTQAGLARSGFDGFRDGLRLLSGYVEQLWDSLHAMGEDEEDRQAMRINSLEELSHQKTLNLVLHAPLTLSRVAGIFGYIAMEGSDGKHGSPGQFAAALEGTRQENPEHLPNLCETIAECISLIDSLEASLNAKLDQAGPIELSGLSGKLSRILSAISTNEAEPEVEEFQEQGGGLAPVRTGPIQSRTDVLAMLDQIIAYYEKNEPANPIPYLMHRARRMAEMDFLEILQELSSDRKPNNDMRHVLGAVDD